MCAELSLGVMVQLSALAADPAPSKARNGPKLCLDQASTRQTPQSAAKPFRSSRCVVRGVYAAHSFMRYLQNALAHFTSSNAHAHHVMSLLELTHGLMSIGRFSFVLCRLRASRCREALPPMVARLGLAITPQCATLREAQRGACRRRAISICLMTRTRRRRETTTRRCVFVAHVQPQRSVPGQPGCPILLVGRITDTNQSLRNNHGINAVKSGLTRI